MSNLRIKAFISTTGFLIVLWFFIFIPAWSLRYWQGWIFWSVFSLSVIFVTLYFLKKDPKLIESRIAAGPIAETQKNQKIIQFFASVSFLFLLIIPGLDFRFHWSYIPILFVSMGNFFVFLGFLIVFFVFKENSFTSATIEIAKEQKVVSTGPYRIVRHPMYSGGLLLIFFMPIALGSLWALIIVIPMTIAIIFRLLNEEKYLSKDLIGYKEYCKKTRYRLIPSLW